MTNRERMKNDITTTDKRETVDKAIRDNRVRNDDLTRERRSKADKTMDENRLRNDEITANRREVKDGNRNMAFAVFLLALMVLTAGAFFLFI